jgi:hypothetical protein
MSFFCQIPGCSKTGRTGSYHGNPVSGFLRYFRNKYIAVFSFIIRYKPLKITYTYGIGFFANYTNLFTLIFLWAYSAAYGGEAVSFFYLTGCTNKVTFTYKLNKRRNIYVNRTSFIA